MIAQTPRFLEGTPVWLLRLVFVCAGALGGLGVAALVAVAVFASPGDGPLVEVKIRNSSRHDTAVRLDTSRAQRVAVAEEVVLRDERSGDHKLELTTGGNAEITVELDFETAEWGSKFLVELLEAPSP